MSTEPKEACPFCASVVIRKHGANCLYCRTCGAQGPNGNNSDEEDTATWDRRPLESALRAEVVKLQARIAGLEKSLHHERYSNMVREEERCDEERGYQL